MNYFNQGSKIIEYLKAIQLYSVKVLKYWNTNISNDKM